jgi:hypothetical protein
MNSNSTNESGLDAKGKSVGDGHWPAVTHYYVFNENTLCYKYPESLTYGVLAGSVIRGGRNWLDGPFYATELDVKRPATREDFATYRCCVPTGFIDATSIPQRISLHRLRRVVG